MSEIYKEDFVVSDFHSRDLTHIDFKYEHKTQCPKCADEGADNSGDNLHVFGLDDNQEPLGAKCFSCDFKVPSMAHERSKKTGGFGSTEPTKSYSNNTIRSRVKRKPDDLDKKRLTLEEINKINSETVDVLPIKYRGLQRYNKIMEKIGVRWKIGKSLDGSDVVERMYFPVFYFNGDKRELVGYRIRVAYKNGEPYKDFYAKGYSGIDGSELLGKSYNSKIADTLIVVGGEVDLITVMGAAQDIMQRYKAHSINVVSVINGEKSLAESLKSDYDWVVSHNKIVLAMDNDKAGQDAIDEALKVLPTEQCYSANFGEYNDPNAYGLELEQLKSDIYWKVQPFDDFGYLPMEPLVWVSGLISLLVHQLVNQQLLMLGKMLGFHYHHISKRLTHLKPHLVAMGLKKFQLWLVRTSLKSLVKKRVLSFTRHIDKSI